MRDRRAARAPLCAVVLLLGPDRARGPFSAVGSRGAFHLSKSGTGGEGDAHHTRAAVPSRSARPLRAHADAHRRAPAARPAATRVGAYDGSQRDRTLYRRLL